MFRDKFFPPFGSGSKLPYINATRLVNQSIPNATFTKVIFNVVNANDSSNFSLNTGTGDVTLLNTGIFSFTFNTIWAASGVGVRFCQVAINDSGNNYGYWSEMTQLALLPAGITQVTCTQRVVFTNAVVSFVVYQNSGAALNLGIGNINLLFNITRLSDL